MNNGLLCKIWANWNSTWMSPQNGGLNQEKTNHPLKNTSVKNSNMTFIQETFLMMSNPRCLIS